VNAQSVTFTAQTTATPGNGQLQAQANGTTFLASNPTQTITVLPPATPVLTIDNSFNPVSTATGVRQAHYVQLPTAVTGAPVSVNLVSSDASRLQLALCDATNSQSNTCTATTANNAGITVSIPVGHSYAYFDMVGLTTPSTDTRLNNPMDVAVDGTGAIYVADYNNYVVRKLSGGVLSTIAGNGSSTVSLGSTALSTGMRPIGVTVDSASNLYVTSFNGNVIYQVTPSGGISVIAGVQNSCAFADGALGTGQLCRPYQVAIGPDGSLYIADYANSRVRKIASLTGGAVPLNGTLTTIAGGGTTTPAAGVTATSASLGQIAGVAVDPATNDVYFSDYTNHQVWKIAQSGPAPGQLVLIGGTGTAGYNGDQTDATQAQLYYPAHLSLNGSSLYIADQYNQRIRQVTTTGTTRPLATVAGTTGSAGFNGDGNAAIVSQLSYPFGMTTDSTGNLYIADQNNNRIREVLASTSVIQTVIGGGNPGYTGDGLSGRGVTITASIAPATGAPNYLPVTVSADIEQSTWQFVNTSSPISGPAVPFTVRQTSPVGGNMRMNSSTTFTLTPLNANVFSLPPTLTIPNNGTSVTPPAYAISSITRSNSVVTATVGSAAGLTTGQIVGISGVTDSSFNGVVTITGVTATTFTYNQSGTSTTSSGGSASTAATIGSASLQQIIAQASTTGIAQGASPTITVTPVFTSVSPTSGTHGGPAVPVTIIGQNFLGLTGITAPAGITVTNIVVTADGSTISANVGIPSGVAAGPYTLTINTPTGNPTFTFNVN
jgi:sugar lactone lactonase YvrE